MNRDEFLNILKEGLSDFPEMELNDILYDYREHFDAALASGKSNEEIIEELGDPNDLINQYRSGYIQKYTASNDTNSSQNNFSNNDTHTSETNSYTKSKSNSNMSDTTSQIIKLLLIICGLIFLGPVATGVIAGIFGLLLGLIALFFGITLGGIGLLLGTSFTNILGFVTIPTFITEFPSSVIALFTAGGFLGLIFSILVIYYLIKLFVRYMKKFINWVSPKLRGEK